MSPPPAPRLALGTVQFGLTYGLYHSGAPLARDEARAVLEAAWRGGIDLLDTGAAYGDAERAIGEARPPHARFAVVSKTPPLRLSAVDSEAAARTADGVRRSLELLRIEALDGLLVHHAPDLLVPGGDGLFRVLEGLRREGLVRRLGVSVYDAATLKAVLDRYPVQIVQLPLNLLDQRFVRDGTVAQLARAGIEVHARSVFLQGVLLADMVQVPAHLAGARQRIARLHAHCAASGMSRAAAALRFVARCAGVSRIVIGVNNAAQLGENLTAFAAATAAGGDFDASDFALEDADIIDPRRWPQ